MPGETEDPVETEVKEQPVEEAPVIEKDVEEKVLEETQVPLFALQKERRKRQELELENKWLKEQQQKAPEPEPDESRFESVTKEDLTKHEAQILRKVQEGTWIKDNPERFQKVNELLPEFLKRRPNLAAAIEGATNRYEEAWELMDKLSPKEQQVIRKAAQAPVKKEAPASPTQVPKGAALDQAVDVMNMTDEEYSAWRQSKRQRR
jgi:hypothetical protein